MKKAEQTDIAWMPFDSTNEESYPAESGDYLLRCYTEAEYEDGHRILDEGTWFVVGYLNSFVEAGRKEVRLSGAFDTPIECVTEICKILGETYHPAADYDAIAAEQGTTSDKIIKPIL